MGELYRMMDGIAANDGVIAAVLDMNHNVTGRVAVGGLQIYAGLNPVIAGQTVFWQAWMHDPAIRRPTPIATSDALRTTIAR